MIDFHNTVTVQRPIEDVFAFLADFTNIPLWNYYVTDVRQETPRPVRLGSVFAQTRRDDSQRYAITELAPPHLVSIATLAGEHPAFRRRMTLERTGEDTRVHDAWALELGVPRPLEPLAAARARAGVAANLAKLAELLVRGTVRLQDGRTHSLPVHTSGLAS